MHTPIQDRSTLVLTPTLTPSRGVGIGNGPIGNCIFCSHAHMFEASEVHFDLVLLVLSFRTRCKLLDVWWLILMFYLALLLLMVSPPSLVTRSAFSVCSSLFHLIIES